MATKFQQKPQQKRPPTKNPWGNDSPEAQENAHLLDWKQQLSGLAPSNFINELLGIEEPKQPNPDKENRQFSHEAIIFQREMSNQIARETSELHQETRSILEELKKQVKMLENAESSLSGELARVQVDQMPQKAGIYYIRYFEWLITVVRQLRMKVEQGGAWLEQSNGKKKKKGYWQQFKKHGTSFGMSNERSVATSAG